MKFNLLLKSAALALLFAACSSEENAVKTEARNVPTKADSRLGRLQLAAVQNLTQRFQFDAREKKVKFETKKGVTISFDATKLRLNGQPVTGRVNLEYVEIFGLGNMVTANKTTMAYAPDSPRELERRRLERLVSGGEFYINMTDERGTRLDDGTPITLTVPTELTDNAGSETDPGSDGMTGWESTGEDTNGDGNADPEGDVKWDPKEGEQGGDIRVPVVDDKYVFEVLKFGWCNIDKLDQIPGPRTTISINVPSGYNQSNSKCYLAYSAIGNSISPMDMFDNGTNSFKEHYGQVPIGLSCYAIFVSEQSGQWKYAIKPAVVSANGVIVINASDIAVTTESSLINALDALP